MRFLILPWLKYYMNVNPWIFNLDHRFIQQITTNLSDLGPVEHSSGIGREIISRAKHHKGRARKAM